jgi:hypothetical protein
MVNVIVMGASCWLMALVLFMVDPMEFNPSPFLQGVVWLAYGFWCFGIVWSDSKEKKKNNSN